MMPLFLWTIGVAVFLGIIIYKTFYEKEEAE